MVVDKDMVMVLLCLLRYYIGALGNNRCTHDFCSRYHSIPAGSLCCLPSPCQQEQVRLVRNCGRFALPTPGLLFPSRSPRISDFKSKRIRMCSHHWKIWNIKGDSFCASFTYLKLHHSQFIMHLCSFSTRTMEKIIVSFLTSFTIHMTNNLLSGVTCHDHPLYLTFISAPPSSSTTTQIAELILCGSIQGRRQPGQSKPQIS